MPLGPLPGRSPAILFAHGGASAHESPNTSEAFRLALRLGANGFMVRVRQCADGRAVVCDAAGVGWRRRRISTMARHDLPEGIVDVAELFSLLGDSDQLLVHAERNAGLEVIDVAHRAGASERLWLASPDQAALAAWRGAESAVRLVAAARIRALPGGPERFAARLREDGIDGVVMDPSDWTAGLTTLFHRFNRFAFAGASDHVRVISAVIGMGIDGVASAHVDRLVEATGGGVTDSRRG